MIHFILVSHGHEDYIFNLFSKLSHAETNDYRFYIRDNIKSERLKSFCEKHGIFYQSSIKQCGFSSNNNEIVKTLYSNDAVNENDYFVFLNPDVVLSEEALQGLVEIHYQNKYDLFSIDLFKDECFMYRDPSIRFFPRVWDFFSSFFFNINKSIIERSDITSPVKVDWFAGSFIAIKSNVFKSINGFDESYYMYCEDLDLCLRARKKGFYSYYLPQIKAVHFTQHQNRRFFNKHLLWHIKSIFILYAKNFTYLLKCSR